jgi:alpha-1,2-mannosyltransferase
VIWRRFAIAVAVIVIADLWLIWMADAYLHVDTILNADFLTYWAGSRHLLTGAPVYAPEQLSGPYRLGDMDYGTGYVYPPTAAVLTLPLALLPVDLGWLVFNGVALACLGTAVYLVARREGLGQIAAAIVVGVVLFSGPVAQAVIAGNVNLWIGVGLAAAWLWPRTSSWFAVAGALIKLYPGIAILWSIRRRVWSWTPFLLGLGIGIITLAAFGTSLWTEFLTSLSNARPFGAAFPQPPRSVLDPLLGATGASLVAYAATAALGIAALGVPGDRLAFFLLSLAMIMPAQDWHTHYFVIPLIGALPGGLHLIVRSRRRSVSPSALVATAKAG